MQISKTSFGFCNNLSLRPRLLPNPTSVFDICTNTSNSLFISIITHTAFVNLYLYFVVLLKIHSRQDVDRFSARNVQPG